MTAGAFGMRPGHELGDRRALDDLDPVGHVGERAPCWSGKLASRRVWEIGGSMRTDAVAS